MNVPNGYRRGDNDPIRPTPSDRFELPAGPELDALVATHVMGWYHVADSAGSSQGAWIDQTGTKYAELPAFSSDLGSAWRVLDVVKKHSAEARVRFLAEVPSVAELIESPPDSVALMVCQAALRALQA